MFRRLSRQYCSTGKVARVAVAAVDLDRQAVGLQAPFAGPALGDRREHLQQQPRVVRGPGITGVLLVHQAGAVELQRQSALAIGLLRQQHALDVGVFDDADLRLRGILARRPHGPALGTVLRVVQAGLVAGHAEHGGGQADADAGLVHHVEHAVQALAGLADEVAHGASLPSDRVLALAKVQQRVGGAAPAALVVQPGQRDVVALAGELPVGVDQLLGHDEQRNATGAGHRLAVRARNLGQHQVDDVFGQLVLAGGDPHLVALEPVTRPERRPTRSPRHPARRAWPRRSGSNRPGVRSGTWCRRSGRRTR
jgi:hypothetical protein